MENENFLVAALWLIFQTGKSFRFEEFNGKVLTATGIFELFKRLNSAFTSTDMNIQHFNAKAYAIEIGQKYRNTANLPVIRYRSTNGLTYFKTENLVVVRPEQIPHIELPDRILQEYLAIKRKNRTTNPNTISTSDVINSLTKVAIRKLESHSSMGEQRSTGKLNPIEIIIQALVECALITVDADYAISSSLRDPLKLFCTTHKELLQNICALTPADFYCCIVANPSMQAKFGDKISEFLFRPVQARMQFNRWHFIPGNFARDDIPPNRHYFFPPIMPDLAEYCDINRAGHKRSKIRFAIRCPGPDIQDPPIVLGTHEYRGFFDIRVVRTSGNPFVFEDMLKTREILKLMSIVWRNIARSLDDNNGALDSPIITDFQNGFGTINAFSNSAMKPKALGLRE